MLFYMGASLYMDPIAISGPNEHVIASEAAHTKQRPDSQLHKKGIKNATLLRVIAMPLYKTKR